MPRLSSFLPPASGAGSWRGPLGCRSSWRTMARGGSSSSFANKLAGSPHLGLVMLLLTLCRHGARGEGEVLRLDIRSSTLWNGALDLVGLIRCWFGFLLIALLLQRLEREAMGTATVPCNKVVAHGHLLVFGRCATKLRPVSLGGEGMKQNGELICATGRWLGNFELQVGEYHTGALIATVTYDQCGGLSKSRYGVSSDPSWRPLLEILVGIPHLLGASLVVSRWPAVESPIWWRRQRT